MRAFFAVFAAVLVLGCAASDQGRSIVGTGETNEARAYAAEALESGNLSLCARIASQDWMYTCYTQTGKMLKDTDACQALESKNARIACLAGAAQGLRSMKPCAMMDDVVQKDWCEQEFAKSLGG
jgi:hypothetical protein